jgi:micrococcal nuclease
MFEYVVKEVNKVVDGDTIDITIDLGFSLTTKQRVRLNGIDTPESITKDQYEKQFGLEAKEFIAKWLMSGKNISVKTEKDDKYGRILGHFYADGSSESLNEALVRLGYAWEYDGGTKKKDFNLLLERRKATSNG